MAILSIKIKKTLENWIDSSNFDCIPLHLITLFSYLCCRLTLHFDFLHLCMARTLCRYICKMHIWIVVIMDLALCVRKIVAIQRYQKAKCQFLFTFPLQKSSAKKKLFSNKKLILWRRKSLLF